MNQDNAMRVAGSSAPASSAFVQIAAIMPFFRYAVGPTSQHSPAIPHFTRKGAEAFFEDVVRELPWCGAVMYRRTWRGLVTVREYRPNAVASDGLLADTSTTKGKLTMRTYWDAFLDDLEQHKITDSDAPLKLADLTPRQLLEQFWKWYELRRQSEAKP
jgi:hypothetical protein